MLYIYTRGRGVLYVCVCVCIFTSRAKVTYLDLIARGGRASFNRKLYYFLITFFCFSVVEGRKTAVPRTPYDPCLHCTIYIYTLMYIDIRCIYCILCKVQSQLVPVLYIIVTMHDNNNIILSRQLQRLVGTSDTPVSSAFVLIDGRINVY